MNLSPRALALRLLILALLGVWVWNSLDQPVSEGVLELIPTSVADPALALPGGPPSGGPELLFERAAAVQAAGCPVPAGTVLTLKLGPGGLGEALLVPAPEPALRTCLEAALAAAPWPAGAASLELSF